MPERIVRVTLAAQVAQYKAAMMEAAQATRTVGTASEKLAQQRQAFEQLGKSMLAVGGSMAAGIGFAVAKFADFDVAMSNVAATGADAKASLDALREAALEAGANTVFSATESANAIEEMAKAGVSAKDILGGGLSGALDLAAAGGLEVADAAGIAATALKTFGLQGTDMSHVADLLAAGAGKAMGDVTDLSAALAQGGQVAAATGLSIEETTAALASFASQGLLGSDAGTSLKTMLQRLTPQSKEAEEAFDRLGVSAYDANGQFVGLANFSGQLQTAMRDMTPEARNAAMAVMFGSDAVRAANVLYREGEAGIRQWISAVDDQGFASQQASDRLENLKGDIEAFQGAIDTALIKIGEAGNGPLRSFIQSMTRAIDGFSDLPEPAQQAIGVITAVGAATGIAGGAFFTAVPKLAEFNAVVGKMTPGVQRTSRVLGALGKTAGATAGFIALTSAAASLADALDGVDHKAKPVEETLKNFLADDIDANFADVAVEATDLASALELLLGNELNSNMERFGSSINFLGLPDQVRNTREQFESMGQALAQLVNSGESERASKIFGEIAAKARELGYDVDDVSGLMPAYAEALDGAANSATLAADETTGAADAAATLAEESANAASDLDMMVSALEGVAATAMDMYGSIDSARGSINALTDAAAAEGATLDGTNDASIRLRDSMRDVEEKHRDAAKAILENGGSIEDATAKWREGRNELVRQRMAMGESEDAARAWADEQMGSSADVRRALADVKSAVDAIPDSASIDVRANTSAAVNTLKGFINRYGTLQGTINYRAVKSVETGAEIPGRAHGGAVTGPGTATSDSILVRLSNGEHVIPADEVARAGGQPAIYAWREAMRDGGLDARMLSAAGFRGFASGGAVSLSRAEDAVQRAKARLNSARTKNARAKARNALADAEEELASVRADFRSELRDFNRENRRGENREAGENGNGLSLVDRLIDAADNTGGAYGKRLRDRALNQEREYLRLEKAAENASEAVKTSADKLSDLKSRVAQMASAVSGALRRTFDVSSWQAGSRQVAQTRMVDGVAVTSVTNQNVPLTAGGIAADAKSKADAIQRFQQKLSRMRAMGYAPALVEEIAMLGTAAGEPVADAMLAGTKSEMQSINASYAKAGSYADLAGDQSAKAQIEDGKSMRELIAAADKQLQADERHAAQIDKRLQTLTDQVLRVLSDAMTRGMKKAAGGPIYGPGTATSDSIPAWLSNGENVWSVSDVKRAGGQAAVERLKHMTPTAPRFAYGGPVGGGADLAPVNLTVNNPVVRDAQKDLNELVQVAGRARRL